MRATVSQLYKNGKRVPHDKHLKMFEGDLNVSDKLHPVLGRLVRETVLLSDGRHVIDSIIDVQLIGIYTDGFRLRGIEYHDGVERAQEWWVRFPS